MAYVAWSVVFGEQPTASKWNILGTNDASFNDGTGIGTNAIAAASLKTDTIKLGVTQKTSTFATASASAVQITGLSQSVTVPAGGRSLRITAYIGDATNTVAQNFAQLSIWDGTVGSGTQIAYAAHSGNAAANHPVQVIAMAIVTPAAGAKTYNVGLATTGGTITMNASATAPAFILVEAI